MVEGLYFLKYFLEMNLFKYDFDCGDWLVLNDIEELYKCLMLFLRKLVELKWN